MKYRACLATMLAAGMLAAGAVPAATHKVDDSASQVLGNTVKMEWDSAVPQARQRQTMSGAIAVLVRLNVAAWKGQQGKIYLTLPAQAAGPVTVEWSARGPLLPGTLRAGERTLVYSGPIQVEMIEDTLRLVIQADGERLVRTEQLNFSFEIDVE